MALPQEKYYTIDDIYDLSEGTRAELIDGQLYYMSPSPSRKHQKISRELLYKITDEIKKSKGTCEVYSAPFAVFLNADDKTYLEPDISVIYDSDKLDDAGCKGAPDWIIEIVSPHNPSHDYIKKLNLYEQAGVREYWIVDPRTELVHVYFFENDILAKPYTFKDKIKVNIYNELIIDFNLLDL